MPQIFIEGHTSMSQEWWQSLENDGPKTGMVPGLVVFTLFHFQLRTQRRLPSV